MNPLNVIVFIITKDKINEVKQKRKYKFNK